MAEINAKQVQALRAKTDLPMMDCKQALVATHGDEKQALELLRKKFADKMTARAEKETANGRIGVFADDKAVAMVEVRCETDFVGNNEQFKALADQIAEQCARTGIIDVEQLKAHKIAGGRTVQDLVTDAYGKFKENMGIHRAKRMEGAGACYVHHNGKVGVAIVCDVLPGEAGRHVCMHIASTAVILGVGRESVDPAADERNRRQARADQREDRSRQAGEVVRRSRAERAAVRHGRQEDRGGLCQGERFYHQGVHQV
jgi:elongation factor Ts